MQLFTLMSFFCMLPFKNLELNGETEIPHPYGRFFPLCWAVNHGEKNHAIYTFVPLLFFIYSADRHNLVEVSHRLQLF